MPTGREKAIFLSALDQRSELEREAYLAEACGNDPALRRAMDQLLAAHERTNNVLDEDSEPCRRLHKQLQNAAIALGLDTTAMLASPGPIAAADRTGEEIGNFRLMEKIGEGGFGQVYVAEQQRPVRRRVALKLLKPGMDSREVIARFEAERQALAMMDHPHIAQVFDAGQTAAGQPYFVMELVRGVPITSFCQHQQLAIRQRLELFVDVCQAVQHAHQKGVIHRDLKPSNVMITLHDATPVVKVIDFGVAKAIGEPLTDKTVYTRFAQMLGTPMYMSPEQAEMNALDVDTRSDIYSLGVVLYELLTGTTPFDQRRLLTATFDELRRIIRDEEPPRPSARLSTLSRAPTTVSMVPNQEPRSLATVLRGDLDWVVMKALEKDRRRRYDTATDFARDVQRYLHDQPVIARPPSNGYRFSKFVRRNKVVFSTAALVLLALVIGTAVSTWQAIRATRARAEAEALRKEAVEFADRLKETNVLLDSARANADEERWSLAAAQYTKATELQPDHYLTWSGRGSLYIRLGAWQAAAGDFAKALKLGAPANNPSWWGVPQLCLYAGETEAYRLARARLGEQLRQAEEPFFVTFAVRSLLIQPCPADDAHALASRMEQLLEDQSLKGFGPAPFRRPPPEFPPAPPDRNRPGGPARGAGGFPHPPGPPLELQWYAAGLAHFRAGDLERSLPRLRQVADANAGFPARRIALPVLAMALEKSGMTTEAEQALDQAGQFLDDWIATLGEDSPQQQPVPWFDFIECLILHREAHQLIRGAPPAVDERLAQIEERVLASLRSE